MTSSKYQEFQSFNRNENQKSIEQSKNTRKEDYLSKRETLLILSKNLLKQKRHFIERKKNGSDEITKDKKISSIRDSMTLMQSKDFSLK